MSCLLCYVLSLRRADYSSRGVIPVLSVVVCLSVISKPQQLNGMRVIKTGYKQKMNGDRKLYRFTTIWSTIQKTWTPMV
jgi:hypothetical protein